jgi:hypothetical protein
MNHPPSSAPHESGLDEDALASLRRYVRNGGLSLVAGEALLYDSDGHRLHDFALASEMGVSFVATPAPAASAPGQTGPPVRTCETPAADSPGGQANNHRVGPGTGGFRTAVPRGDDCDLGGREHPVSTRPPVLRGRRPDSLCRNVGRCASDSRRDRQDGRRSTASVVSPLGTGDPDVPEEGFPVDPPPDERWRLRRGHPPQLRTSGKGRRSISRPWLGLRSGRNGRGCADQCERPGERPPAGIRVDSRRDGAGGTPLGTWQWKATITARLAMSLTLRPRRRPRETSLRVG